MARSLRAQLLARSFPTLALASCALLAWAAPLARAQGPCRPAIEYGMNPSFQTWSSRAIVFADALQRVRRFTIWNRGQPTGDAELIPVGRGALGAGWPDPARLPAGERYGAFLFGSMEGTIPDGRTRPYVLTWKGSGEARLEGPNVTGEQNRSANRVEFFVDPTRGTGNNTLSVSWSAPSAADPLRDLHVWLPGMEASGLVFWPPFLDKVRAVNAGLAPHTWRTLDWTRVNDYGRPQARDGFVFDLAGVITSASPSQGTLRGVAPEYQVALCNALGMNLHIQLPHRTSDLSESDYVLFLERELRVVRDGAPAVPGVNGGRPFAPLDPSLTVTVELSNEIWNSLFPVNAWMNAEAARRGLSLSQQIASQIQLVFGVAEGVFSGAERARLRTFVGGFSADPGFLRRVLASLAPGTRIDALGPAAYLGPRRPDMDAWLTGATSTSCPNCPSPDELLATAEAAIVALRPLLAEHRNLADRWNNPDGSHPALELYEGGLNLKATFKPWAAAARALQTDARLFDLLSDDLVPMLIDEGVDLINWYSFMSDQDSTLVDAYGFWNDMEQSLTLPVVKPYVHQGAPKAAFVCFGPPLQSSCARASATLRTAPGNVGVYSTTAPVLGTTLHAEVDLSASGNQSAFVVASLAPIQVQLPWGQTIFSPLDSPDFLPLMNGPIARWKVPIPNDPRLAGIKITTQAFLIGGTSPANLSNAVDLVFGR